MKSNRRRPLGLETLENRWVPATVHFDGTNLVVSNIGIDAGISTATVIETATNVFQVEDNGQNNGSYTVTGNITIQGNNAKDTITVNVTNAGLLGNLSATTGNGPANVTVDGAIGKGQGAGTVLGNVTVNMGSGSNSVDIGAGIGLNALGSTTISSKGTSANTLVIGTAVFPSTFSGPVTVTGFPNINPTAAGAQAPTKDIFSSNLTIQSGGTTAASTIVLQGTVQGNLTVLGGQGLAYVEVDNNVLGAVSVNVGNGGTPLDPNALELLGGGIAFGSFSFQAGNGTNELVTDYSEAAASTTVLGNVTVNLGNGTGNRVIVVGSAPNPGLVVDGNMTVNDGNGGLGLSIDQFQGAVYGNLTVNASNGPNFFYLDGTDGAVVGGTFNYNGGNGGNSVTVDNASANGVTMNVRMGNLPQNLFTIEGGATPGTLTGQVSWATPSGADANPPTMNGFADNGYVWQNNITLTNVPSGSGLI